MSKITDIRFYICEKCGVHIRVLSSSYHRGWKYGKKISACPQCGSNNIKESAYSIFNEIEHDLWINVTKHNIKYSLKFPVKKNLLKKASPKEGKK